ncbi:MAG: YlmC/YmxH family sporulation protein [Clostridia bacterium]|nr:YlmC/YmxH family sporulation protein [Clostridia bacterium]
MVCRMDELQRKDVISVKDGSRLGRVGDAEVDTENARLVSIVIYGRPKLFGLLGHEEDTVIRWCDIEVIGADTILVSGSVPVPQPKRPRWLQKFWG